MDLGTCFAGSNRESWDPITSHNSSRTSSLTLRIQTIVNITPFVLAISTQVFLGNSYSQKEDLSFGKRCPIWPGLLHFHSPGLGVVSAGGTVTVCERGMASVLEVGRFPSGDNCQTGETPLRRLPTLDGPAQRTQHYHFNNCFTNPVAHSLGGFDSGRMCMQLQYL